MLRLLFKMFGMRALKTAVAGGKRPPMLDFGLGLALLRDRRVPIQSKLTALALGVVALVVLNTLELPVEMLIAALLNVPGIGIDLLIEGVEIIAGPLLFGALFLTRFAPREIVQQMRAERYGVYTVDSAPRPPVANPRMFDRV